jgi:oligoendopeptidase F
MINSLPDSIQEFMGWPWPQIEPHYQALLDAPIHSGNVARWLSDWTRLSDLVSERYARLNVALSQDTADKAAESRYNNFLDSIHLAAQAYEQKLKGKLLASGLQPDHFENPLRKMLAEAAIFREANLPLLSEERKLASQYNKIIGGQTVQWEGEELTLQQMRPFFHRQDRSLRQAAWKLCAARQLADREATNTLWGKFLDVRRQLAENCGFSSYRDYRWQQMLRLDYTPEDCLQFQDAIERVAVPAATRIYEKHRRRLGLDALRPWDLDQDLYPVHLPPLPSYGSIARLIQGAETIFRHLDPTFSQYFATMRTEELLDLDNRKGKGPGGYCTSFPVSKRPFIFMNAVGLLTDVNTIIHESGHAFHNFERFQLPYAQQRIPGLEFAEVASTSMELLAGPYLGTSQGGFYSEADAARAQVQHLEKIILFWPYMAVVDSFQHWVYANLGEARDPARCDAKWLELWMRYIPGVDWSELEAEAMTGWHRKLHIHRYPFYYVEYGVAQLGAVQVWRNALEDQAGAVTAYRRALSLGGTAPLPQLYAAAGAKFAFDTGTLQEAVDLVESITEELESKARP